MRFTLKVDDRVSGAPSVTRAGDTADLTTSALGPEASAADDGDTSISSPGAADAGVGAGESQEPPGTGAGDSDSPDGGVEAVEGYELPDAEAAAEASTQADEELPDIGEASFGTGPRAVIGADDRVQITATSTYPWSVHASLRITANDGSQWIGTGWFCGPHTLITAGHCVYIKNSGVPGRDGWVRSITVIPGRNAAQQPFGSAVSSNLRTVTGWANSGNQEYDYGAIILSTDLGSTHRLAGVRGVLRCDAARVDREHLGLPG